MNRRQTIRVPSKGNSYDGSVNERYRPPVLIIIFLNKIYSLCKNNAISEVLNKLQVFHFRCTVHTNTTTVITHWCVLQKPPFCNDNGLSL